MNEIITVHHAARICEVTPQAIRYMARRHKFPGAYRAGTSKESPWRIPRSEVIASKEQKQIQ